MIIKNLYRYTRPDGGVTVSTVQPDSEYTTAYRLIADEGMMLTNGVDTAPCVDVATPEGWTEIPDPGEEGEPMEERVKELEETIEGMANAYREGVEDA